MEKHAFLIIAHTDWSLLKTLVSLLDYELNDIYIHIDAKVPAKAIPDIICSKSNLYMLEHRISVAWGDISVVEAEYLLFEIAYNNSHYGYYHLLSGVDLPLKSKEYIYSFFMQSGKEFIGFCVNKVTTKKRNAERYSDRIELQGFQSCFRLFVKPSQSPLKPNQDAATLLVRNHARNGDKRTRITKQGVKD